MKLTGQDISRIILEQEGKIFRRIKMQLHITICHGLNLIYMCMCVYVYVCILRIIFFEKAGRSIYSQKHEKYVPRIQICDCVVTRYS